MSNWYAVQVNDELDLRRGRAGHVEFAAVKRILRDGFEAFTPRMMQEMARRHHGPDRQRQRVPVPLFPGYAFARLDDWGLQRLRRWPECLDVIRMDPEGTGQRKPYVLSDALVEAVRKLDLAIEDLEGDAGEVLEQILRAGDHVELKDPLYHGAVGTVLDAEDRAHLVVLMAWFGTQRPVKVARSAVKVVG